MRSLDDASIAGMSEDELRAELSSLRDRYRALHRREQRAVAYTERAGLRNQITRANETAERRSKAWLYEFERVCKTHQVMKEIFELAAKKLNLPHGLYHSVSDLAFGRKYDGGIYANVLLDRKKGGIATFNVKDVVDQAINANAA